MAEMGASMATGHLFVARVVAFRCHSPADYGRSKGSCPAWTGLRLRVDHWAFLTQAGMAGQIAGMFLTVQHPLACQLALMSFRPNQVLKFTAFSVTDMDTAASFLLTDGITMELLLGVSSLETLDLADRCSASTRLLDQDYALWTSSFVADLRALVAT